MKNEADLETVRKAVYGITPDLIYNHGLTPMEAMVIALYRLGYRNIETTEMMRVLMEKPELSRQQVNDCARKANKKLTPEEPSGEVQE